MIDPFKSVRSDRIAYHEKLDRLSFTKFTEMIPLHFITKVSEKFTRSSDKSWIRYWCFLLIVSAKLFKFILL